MCHDDDLAAQLRSSGVAILRDTFPTGSLIRIRDAAELCFSAIAAGQPTPQRYRLDRFSNSLLLAALLDFGCADEKELLWPLHASRLATLLSEAGASDWACNLQQSWLRKKSVTRYTPPGERQIQGWHQDGALGVRFPQQPGPPPAMTELLTCWIPLHPCGVDRPGLEFIRRPQPSLLHFTELDDAGLRRRFQHADFFAPRLACGDGLVFLNNVLHRTHITPAMQRDRLSIEYRLFPTEEPCKSNPFQPAENC